MWVARLEGIDESTLGRKGKSGILESVASVVDSSDSINCLAESTSIGRWSSG
jgi:hypothetical protein